jgi:SAM-dependent methyltransferase
MSSVTHYNKVALDAPAQCSVLRRAHNVAKRALLTHALSIVPITIADCDVLDLACGRGGDLNKLCGCRTYTGADTALYALNELERRAAEIDMQVTVYHVDAAQVPDGMYHLAICNFALHYFCDTMEHCAALLDKVSSCLRPDGVFCGTFERVQTGTVWGTAHHAVVGDCVDAVEWRVPWPAVVSIAHAKGLAVVTEVPFYMCDEGSDRSIWGFIIQKARAQYCGTKQPDSAR